MAFCSKCGGEVEPAATVCPTCGHSLVFNKPDPQQPQPQPQQIHQIPVQQGYQPNYQNVYPQGYPHAKNAGKPKFITFIFVSSLVFMIFLITQTFSGLMVISDYTEYKGLSKTFDALISSAYFSVAATALAMAAAITLFVFATTLRSNNASKETRAKRSGILLILTFVALGTAIIYTISDIVFVGNVRKAYDEKLVEDFKNTTYAALVFDITYLVFCVLNIVKAISFKAEATKSNTPPSESVFG